MTPTEMAALIKKEHPELFEKMSEQRVARIVRVVFSHVGKQLDALTEGALHVPAFGNFRLRLVESEKDGQKVTIKRLGFRRAKERPAAEGRRPAGRSRKARREKEE